MHPDEFSASLFKLGGSALRIWDVLKKKCTLDEIPKICEKAAVHGASLEKDGFDWVDKETRKRKGVAADVLRDFDLNLQRLARCILDLDKVVNPKRNKKAWVKRKDEVKMRKIEIGGLGIALLLIMVDYILLHSIGRGSGMVAKKAASFLQDSTLGVNERLDEVHRLIKDEYDTSRNPPRRRRNMSPSTRSSRSRTIDGSLYRTRSLSPSSFTYSSTWSESSDHHRTPKRQDSFVSEDSFDGDSYDHRDWDTRTTSSTSTYSESAYEPPRRVHFEPQQSRGPRWDCDDWHDHNNVHRLRRDNRDIHEKRRVFEFGTPLTTPSRAPNPPPYMRIRTTSAPPNIRPQPQRTPTTPRTPTRFPPPPHMNHYVTYVPATPTTPKPPPRFTHATCPPPRPPLQKMYTSGPSSARYPPPPNFNTPAYAPPRHTRHRSEGAIPGPGPAIPRFTRAETWPPRNPTERQRFYGMV